MRPLRLPAFVHLRRTVPWLALLMLMLAPNAAHAQRYPRHAVSVDYAGLVLYGSAGLHYEFLATPQMSVRVGYGRSYATVIVSDIRAEGWSGMLNFMTRGRNKIEGGIGVSIMRSNFGMIFNDERLELGTRVFPSLALAYRTLPRRHGWFWRFGLTWIYGYGLPLTLGVGYVF